MSSTASPELAKSACVILGLVKADRLLDPAVEVHAKNHGAHREVLTERILAEIFQAGAISGVAGDVGVRSDVAALAVSSDQEPLAVMSPGYRSVAVK